MTTHLRSFCLCVNVTYDQNTPANDRNTTRVDCNVKIDKRKAAQMDRMCESTAAGDISARARQWDSEVGSAGVTELEAELTDRIRDDSAEPGPAAQRLTAEYTWPGSFGARRDNWERLPPQLRSNLTQAIVCAGRSSRSGSDSNNA